MKKILLILLSCVLGFFLSAATEAVNGIEWTYTVVGQHAEVTACANPNGALEIPSTLGGYPVTSIGSSAFRDCSSLTSVTIPEGVTSIGGSAFRGCSSLTSVTIPSSVTSIGDYAFYNCSSLTAVTIPEGVRYIGSYAFSGCDRLWKDANGVQYESEEKVVLIDVPNDWVGEFIIPTSMRFIHSSAFSDCSNLTSVTIPEGVISIGDSAFDLCSGLTSVIIPEGVTSIGGSAFRGCSLFVVTIPASVTWVGRGAFQGGEYLVFKGMPPSGYYWGYLYSGVSCYYLLENAAEWERVHGNSDKWRSAHVYEEGVTYYVSEKEGDDTNNGQSVNSPFRTIQRAIDVANSGATIVVDDGVYTPISVGQKLLTISSVNGAKRTVIDGALVERCADLGGSTLSGFTLQNGRAEYGGGAYQGCLHHCVITGCLAEGGGGAYESILYDCLITENAATNYGGGVYGSAATRSIFSCNSAYSGAGISAGRCRSCLIVNNSGGDGANVGVYYNCTFFGNKLAGSASYTAAYNSIVLCDRPNSDAYLYSCYNGVPQFVDADNGDFRVLNGPCVNAGNNAYVRDETDLNGLNRIVGGNVDIGCYEYHSVQDVFKYESNADGITILGLNDCNPTKLEIPEMIDGQWVTVIGDEAFLNCADLTSVTIPSRVTLIGENSFSGCTRLVSVEIPEGVTSIGANAFSGCTGLTSVMIPSSVIHIGDSAFWGCIGLCSVIFKGEPPDVGPFTFPDTKGRYLAKYASTWETVIEDSGKWGGLTMQQEADASYFKYRIANGEVTITGLVDESEVVELIIPETIEGYPVTTIGGGAFCDCTGLTSVTIPEGVEVIEYSAFLRCSNLASVTIPSSMKSVGYGAFWDCTKLYKDENGIQYESERKTLLIRVTTPLKGDFQIPSTVTLIGSDAFCECPDLTSVTIPAGVKEIGSYAFRACEERTFINFNGGPPQVGDQVFSSARGTYLPKYTIPWKLVVDSKGMWNNLTMRRMGVTITFDAAGGEGGTSVMQDYGSALTAPTVTREGYTFVGWSPEVPATVPAENATYTAQWQINQYTITFDANDGVGGASVTQDYAVGLTAPTVTREGYTFMGWSPEVPSTVPAENTTYIAQWQINQYTITFEANGGEGGTSVTQDYGSELTAPTVTREGYIFVGWSPEVPAIVPAENATYTAQWVKLSTVTINRIGDGTVSGAGLYCAGETVTVTAKPSKNTFFCGWLGYQNVVEETISFVMPEEDVTLSAYFANLDALEIYLAAHEHVSGGDLDSLVEAEIAKRDLHTADEMKEMVIGTPLIEVKHGVVIIRFQVKDGVTNQVMDGGEISVEIVPKEGEKAGFYKFVVPDEQ